jgi:2-(1,2-epoxy-1,2-dihydrophenyl)acetyl-CoA isomerase
MSMMLTERRGAVAILTLNNPTQLNALGGTLLADLNAAVDTALADASVRAIVLTGAGRGFCAGAQLGGPTFDAGDRVGALLRNGVSPLVEKLRGARVPVVSAVNGPAAGAGVGVALAADVVIAARSARFLLAFVKLGAALDAGTSLFLQRAIGVPRARAMAMLGEPIDADTAAQWGLIWKAVDDAVLMDEALKVAQRLADGPPISLGLIKQQVEAGWDASLADALEGEAIAQAKAFVTEDLREGAAAFVEKRPPRFNGR